MPQDAERLLREALTAIEEIHTDQCQAWCGYRELRGEIRAHLSSIESKERAVDEEVCPACFSAIRQPSTCADAWHRNPAPTVQSETPRPRDIEWLSPEVIKYVESLELRLAQRDTQLREAERRLRMAKALEGKTTVSEPHAYVQSETPEEPEIIEKIMRCKGATEIRVGDQWEKIADLRAAANQQDAFADLVVSQFDELAKLLPIAEAYRALRSLLSQREERISVLEKIGAIREECLRNAEAELARGRK